jgi:hypothetical protein
VDMLANDPPESIIVHRLDWMSCIVKSAVVLLPVIAHFYGAEQRLVSLSGYIGLCLLLGPALPGGQSLYYIPSPEGIRHQMYPLRRYIFRTFRNWVMRKFESLKLYISRFIRERPGEKLNLMLLSVALFIPISFVRWIFPGFSVKNLITQLPWFPGLYGSEHLDFIGDTLMLMSIIVLFLKSLMSLAPLLKYKSSLMNFMYVGVCNVIGYWTISILLSYTALIEAHGWHYGTASLLAIVPRR